MSCSAVRSFASAAAVAASLVATAVPSAVRASVIEGFESESLGDTGDQLDQFQRPTAGGGNPVTVPGAIVNGGTPAAPDKVFQISNVSATTNQFGIFRQRTSDAYAGTYFVQSEIKLLAPASAGLIAIGTTSAAAGAYVRDYELSLNQANSVLSILENGTVLATIGLPAARTAIGDSTLNYANPNLFRLSIDTTSVTGQAQLSASINGVTALSFTDATPFQGTAPTTVAAVLSVRALTASTAGGQYDDVLAGPFGTSVPEPATLAAAGGAIALGAGRRRRRA